jgi:tetratricopeptide (TPR) repeat protein
MSVLACLLACASGCGGTKPADPPSTSTSASSASSADTIPPEHLEAVLAAHRKGIGHMERYVEYPDAVKEFRKVHELAPGWAPGSINLAIALLNTSGEAAEKEKDKNGGGEPSEPPVSNFDEALALLDGVLEREPNNLHAHYCRGVILEYIGQSREAHTAFQKVVALDPSDGHAWYKVGSTLPSADNPDAPAGPNEAEEMIRIYTRALECNPYLVPALYRLQMSYAFSKRPDKAARQRELLNLWRRLNPKQNAAAPGDPAETVYGEMGRYATLIDYEPPARVAGEGGSVSPPRFDTPARLTIELPAGHRWSRSDDFKGELESLGAVRARFSAAVASFDANADGLLDLYLTSAVTTDKGVRDALLINRGEGRFEDASASWSLPDDRPSLSVAAGDLDADNRIDLALGTTDGLRVLRNTGAGFERVRDGLPADAGRGSIVLSPRWLDLDQDGDLDLYAVVLRGPLETGATAGSDSNPPGLNIALRNDGKPAEVAGRPPDNWAPVGTAPKDLPATEGLSIAFSTWPEEGAEALGGGLAHHTGVAALDADGDRDIDLVLTSEVGAPRLAINDRLGRFHGIELSDLKPPAPALGVLATELDGDGRTDLVIVPERGKLALWRSREPERGKPDAAAFEFFPTDAHDWRMAIAADLDLDGRADLVGLPAAGERAPVWARHVGNSLAASALALGPDSTAALDGLALVDLVGDPRPDLVLVRDGEGPSLARNLGNANHWMALDLSGKWKASFDRMRSNPHGLGVKVQLQGPNLKVLYDHTTTSSGLSQSVGPVVLGLGPATSADLVRLVWPDGVMQCELNKNGDQVLALAETNRKTGSCPVLFTWNGERFVCIGDFLGGGGMGYLVAPGVYSQPDRDEAVAISGDELRPEQGEFRLSVTEPMDEVAYLDRLDLEIIDAPPGVDVSPEERFAPGGNRPSGKLLAWRERIDPVKATDLTGATDLTKTLAAFDRRTADGFKRLGSWIGYAEEHGITLDFGDRLSRFGPTDRLVLVLSGWVEYPYSQTNYAAATAGVALQPPVLERRNDDGSWSVLEADPGYPAGLPRRTTLELTGKLGDASSCVLRLRTNMECYYDEAFLAVAQPDLDAAGVRTTTRPVARAELRDRGYTREVSPDGRDPLLYDYDHIDPAPLAPLRGRLTRFGDVAELLRSDDDRLCVLGPGDEVRLAFDATELPPLPDGWSRRYVLRSTGYCKDADPLTGGSDTVGPLPWKGMPDFPFADPDAARPRDAAYDDYLRTYQTRNAGP